MHAAWAPIAAGPIRVVETASQVDVIFDNVSAFFLFGGWVWVWGVIGVGDGGAVSTFRTFMCVHVSTNLHTVSHPKTLHAKPSRSSVYQVKPYTGGGPTYFKLTLFSTGVFKLQVRTGCRKSA